MPFASERVVRTWLFITVLSVVAVCFVAPEDKRFDLKIGFDITNGENGGPLLRIRDFEDSSDIRQRAKGDDDTGTSPTVRADSSSAESDDKDKQKRKAGRVKDSSADKSDDDDDSGSGDNRRSTRGLNAGDYEPEENVKVHNYREDPSDNESDRIRRRKRFAHYRRKGKSREKVLRL